MFEASFRAVVTLVQADHGIDDSMQTLLDYCQQQLPDPVWADLRVLGWEQEVKGLEIWLRHVLVHEPPPASCLALYFGLFDASDAAYSEEGAICRLYVC